MARMVSLAGITLRLGAHISFSFLSTTSCNLSWHACFSFLDNTTGALLEVRELPLVTS
ncbi:hypothetical protein HanIR_Chr07g0311181 [Helianthus annuus]|nr:hypothetical protein HanIR_Chr07g0311181 [Helianthus annuus]